MLRRDNAESDLRSTLKLNLTDGVLVPQANRKPRRGAELVGVAKRPASAIGGHHDHRAENYPRQGWTAALAKQLGNVSQACKMMGYSRDSFYRYVAPGFMFCARGPGGRVAMICFLAAT